MADQYTLIAKQPESTVVACYERTVRSSQAYESEAELEKEFIAQLKTLGYEYLRIHDEQALLNNLRVRLEELNDYKFTESEWKRFVAQIANEQLTMADKAKIIQHDELLSLLQDDGGNKNIMLIDKDNIARNKLQVINQYKVEDGTHKERYDVTILVNGLPLVHIELKRRGVSIKQAFNQIARYQRDSFWAGTGLYDYVQIFVISNGSETKYYSNTTRFAHCEEMVKAQRKHKMEGNSFEFTSYWSDQRNNVLPEITDFTNTFFAKNTILRVLAKYCVLNSEGQLLVMRPYQIAATEKITGRIRQALLNHKSNDKWLGTVRAGGYIWHTTGSGKTLTSFKTAQLACDIPGVHKVLFVVDRKDLDYQTMKEYDNFKKDCANSNTNGKVLYDQLIDEDAQIIITTIQKLSGVLKNKKYAEKLAPVLEQNIVIIFDECHRSQFGDMHQLITKKFKKYMMFGFTGTPIFAVNANMSAKGKYHTTCETFGGELDEDGNHTKALHTYTVVDAIRDNNVKGFHVDYENTMKLRNGADSKLVWGIDEDSAWHNPKRISLVTQYILDRFAQKTKQGADAFAYTRIDNVSEVVEQEKKAQRGKKVEIEAKKKRVKKAGFNSIFAVDSVKAAIMYYDEFKKQQDALEESKRLKVATIFTYSANEDEDETGLDEDENPEGIGTLDADSRAKLERAIEDYNNMFGTHYSTDGDSFQSYYKDVSLRMKQKDIDILIVVGMFLTGFDAKTLNTLWVDKNLKMHGLIQAYSRTNRILNTVKNVGNIVCFRNLEEATNKALSIFGDENAKGVVIMKTFEEYYKDGYTDAKGEQQPSYVEIVTKLLEAYPLQDMVSLLDDKTKKDFIKLFGILLRMRNLLSAFDEFEADKQLIGEGQMQDYLSWYNKYHEEYKSSNDAEKEKIEEDIEFEMELVKQVQIDITYILQLVQQYHDKQCEDKEIAVKIRKSMEASPDMRDKIELIEKFLERISVKKGETDVTEDWEEFKRKEKEDELNAIIAEEDLRPEETHAFMERSFNRQYVTDTGTEPAKILPPADPFEDDSEEKKKRVLDKLKAFLTKYLNI